MDSSRWQPETSFYPLEDKPRSELDLCNRAFQSAKDSNLFAFTIEPFGNNLPAVNAPWDSTGAAIPLGVTMASTSPEIAQEIELKGFALVQGHAVTQPRVKRTDSTP